MQRKPEINDYVEVIALDMNGYITEVISDDAVRVRIHALSEDIYPTDSLRLIAPPAKTE